MNTRPNQEGVDVVSVVESKTPRSAWLRRGAGLGVAAALIPVAVVVATHAPQSTTSTRPQSTPTPPTTGRPTTSRPARAATAPSASATPSASGPGITTPGIDVSFSPRADGDFEVLERIVTRSPVDRIVLRTPSRAAAGVAFADAEPSVTALQVDSAGQPVRTLADGHLRNRVTVPLDAPARTLTLRYRLGGTSVVPVPSVAGRALAFIRPITAAIDDTLDVALHAAGAGALNLTCPQLPPAEQGCAVGSAPRLSAAGMRAATSTVVVQFDLPEP
jgi:hypothetical protein